MNIIHPIILTALTLTCAPAFAQEQIIPKPVEVIINEGAPIILNEKSAIILGKADKATIAQAKSLQKLLSQGTGLALPLVSANKLPENISKKNSIGIIIDNKLKDKGEEAYSLAATPEGILITAPNPKGIYYAGQSLVQMLPTAFHDSKADKKAITWQISDKPFAITDYPRFAWRALMIDEARYFFGEKAIKQIIDQMALLKMNVLHWGLTNDAGWRIEIKKYPKLTSIGSKRKDSEIGTWRSGKYSGQPHEGFYTQAQIKDIVDYAAKRNITIVPEINMPGHASAATVAYPELSLKPLKEVPATFVTNTAYDPTNEKTYKFLSDVLDEVAALFPSQILHIGGDEVRYNEQWKDQPKIEEFMKKHNIKNLGGVQMYFSNRMSDIVSKKGRRMMGWNEILGEDVNNDGGGKAEETLNPNAVIHFWKGAPALAKKAIKDGHDVINSTHTHTYLDYSYGSIPLDKAYNFEPVFDGLEPKDQAKVKGLGAQMWSEWTPTVERMHYQAFPRTVAYAEVGWTPKEKKDFPDFKKRLQNYSERMDLMGINYAKDIITSISKSDFFNTPQLGKWNKDSFGNNEPEFDATQLIKTPGEYTFTLLYDSGSEGAPIKQVTLLEDGKEIAKDAHEGFSGHEKRNIQYKIKVPTVKEGAKYSVKVKFDGKDQLDSQGTIYAEAP